MPRIVLTLALSAALATCLPQDLTYADRDPPAPSSGGAAGAAGAGGEGGSGGSGGCESSGGCSEGGAGGAASCSRASDCDACVDCAQRSTCADAQLACDSEPDCAALNGCLEACDAANMQCFFDCHAMHPTGSPLWTAAVECVLCECSGHGFAAPCDQDPSMFCGG